MHNEDEWGIVTLSVVLSIRITSPPMAVMMTTREMINFLTLFPITVNHTWHVVARYVLRFCVCIRSGKTSPGHHVITSFNTSVPL